MLISEDRISSLAHLIRDRLKNEKFVEYRDEDEGLREIKRTMRDYFKLYDEIEDIVRKKLASYKKPIPHGSREYDIMYNKFLEEELAKKT